MINRIELEKALNDYVEDMKRRKQSKAEPYNYQWSTAEEIIANLHTLKEFAGSKGTLADLTRVTNPETYRKAHELWLKLKEAFNAEAATYNPEAYDSKLGSVGEVERREVLRSRWWDELSKYEEQEYREITSIIEVLHHGERLETGTILFGS